MNEIRQRAIGHFPSVLLTLLSIVQALAVELLWAHVREADYLYELNLIAMISWAQIIAMFLGIVLIWVVYAGNTMRFRWVPATSDSVIPFFIGLVEFMMVESLGPTEIGPWFVLLGMAFALMNWVAHSTMRRARRDSFNVYFFKNRKPAVLRDFFAELTAVGSLVLTGVVVMVSNITAVAVLLLLLLANALMAWQFMQSAHFWELSISEERDN